MLFMRQECSPWVPSLVHIMKTSNTVLVFSIFIVKNKHLITVNKLVFRGQQINEMLLLIYT